MTKRLCPTTHENTYSLKNSKRPFHHLPQIWPAGPVNHQTGSSAGFLPPLPPPMQSCQISSMMVPSLSSNSSSGKTNVGIPPSVALKSISSFSKDFDESLLPLFEIRSNSNMDLSYIVKGFSEVLSGKIFYNQFYRCMAGLSPFPCGDIFDEVLYPLGDHRMFSSLYPYPLEIQQFVWYLVNARKITVEIVVSAFIYILTLEKSGIYLYASNWRSIILVALLSATKCVGDFCVWNMDWILSTFPLMNVKHLNKLEREFLFVLKYRLFIPQMDYFNAYNYLLRTPGS